MRTAVAALVVIAFAAQAWAADVPEAGIRKSKAELVAAFNKGDAAGIAKVYTDDAHLLPPGAPMVSGRDGIQKFWESSLKSGAKNLSLTTGTVDQMGDVAREIAQFSMDGKNGKVEGKYVAIWKPQYGAWKLDTDIWNMNK